MTEPAFQAAFAPALLDAERPVPMGLTAHTGDRPAKRFAVYRNNVVTSLVEAMRVRFPVIERLVGPEFFIAMARVFVAEHPPKSPLMMYYGDELAHFLEHFAPAAELPYLADIARLEAARTRAYHAADQTALDPARLSGLDPQAVASLRLSLHPSVEIIRSSHPIVTIWAMNSGECEPASIQDWQGEDALVARPGLTVTVSVLPPGGASFIRALMHLQPLGDAATAALDGSTDFDLAGNLAALIGRDLIVGAEQPMDAIS